MNPGVDASRKRAKRLPNIANDLPDRVANVLQAQLSQFNCSYGFYNVADHEVYHYIATSSRARVPCNRNPGRRA
jgi:hypothetical protein